MARNNHLYTVFHSLENQGVFDAPSAGNPEGGKYYQKHTEWPKYIYGMDADGKQISAIVQNDEEANKVRAAWAAGKDKKLKSKSEVAA